MKKHYDVVVVGGGHNGLVAAAYLARAGLSVAVLERRSDVGGAAVSAALFDGHDARFSPYSSLVSLFPDRILTDLDLDLPMASTSAAASAGPAGGAAEPDGWRELQADLADLAHAVAPTLLDPLPTERQLCERVDPGIWRDFVVNPLGATLEERVADDTARGAVAMNALVGTFVSMRDPSLRQNRCFLYHAIGNRSGERRTPVGGIGSLTSALARSAADAGADLVTGIGVSGIRGNEQGAEVSFHDGMAADTVGARFVLADVAPWVLQILLGASDDPETKPQGAQLKIDFLLDRLPRLRSGVDPTEAFAGTVHVGSDYSQLEKAYAEAAAGQVPSLVPGRLECPSLADRTVLGSEPEGTHMLSYLGIHTPAALFDGAARAQARQRAVAGALAAIDEHLDEPLEACLARDAQGNPCLAARIPQDVEAELAMPGGHIYHGDLDWPWASNRARLDTPAQQWGVHTDVDSVLVCGSGARRGGGVSGIGGHNAAQAVLASIGD